MDTTFKPEEYDLDDVREENTGICGDCHREVVANCYSDGFGYEYGSIRGFHREICIECPICGGRVYRGGGTLVREATHTARRDHADGKIKAGDKYQVRVYHCYYENGPGWFMQEKQVIKRFKAPVSRVA